MRALLVYPRYPDTFWSFRHALKFISKKAAFPPLGLLTVASMFPLSWEKRLVDMNVMALRDKDITWADYVFISAMDIQTKSAREVLQRCREMGVKIVAGGPLFTTSYNDFPEVDHLVLGEAEVTLPLFLEDIERGTPKHLYLSDKRPDIQQAPLPAWDLINPKNYACLSLQYSRGCPYDCEFCDIVVLNGRLPRTKSSEQLLRELESIYRLGWRGDIFVVDDNFIGNKVRLKAETLPAIITWMKEHNHPFNLFTQASINLADDEELMRLMIAAGFTSVFVGIETPNEESLKECGKNQNTNRDLVAAVKKLQSSGLEVQGGFIVGFDSDPGSIFDTVTNFIQKSGIVTAMVGLLNAPRGTKLYQRLKREQRLLRDSSGDNTDCSINFVPKMNRETLINGYKRILADIYKPRQYYARIVTFLKEHRPVQRKRQPMAKISDFWALLKSMWYLGVKDKGWYYYWRLFISTLLRRPRLLRLAITLAIYGYHFRKVVAQHSRGSALLNNANDPGWTGAQ